MVLTSKALVPTEAEWNALNTKKKNEWDFRHILVRPAARCYYHSLQELPELNRGAVH
jgi:hypothetical protein